MDGIYEVCGTCAALTTDMKKHMAWHQVTTVATVSATVTVPKPTSVL